MNKDNKKDKLEVVNLFDEEEKNVANTNINEEKIIEIPKTKDALELACENYREYGKYVAQGRAYPSIYDGAKSSYKRAIYGMWKSSPRSIIKVAELAAAALPYHPHPTSVAGVIIQLGENGNKFKFIISSF